MLKGRRSEGVVITAKSRLFPWLPLPQPCLCYPKPHLIGSHADCLPQDTENGCRLLELLSQQRSVLLSVSLSHHKGSHFIIRVPPHPTNPGRFWSIKTKNDNVRSCQSEPLGVSEQRVHHLLQKESLFQQNLASSVVLKSFLCNRELWPWMHHESFSTKTQVLANFFFLDKAVYLSFSLSQDIAFTKGLVN